MSRLLRFIFSRLTVVIFLMLVAGRRHLRRPGVFRQQLRRVPGRLGGLVRRGHNLHHQPGHQLGLQDSVDTAHRLPPHLRHRALRPLRQKAPARAQPRALRRLLHRYKLSISGMQSSSSELARENPSAGKQSYYLEHSAFAPCSGAPTPSSSPPGRSCTRPCWKNCAAPGAISSSSTT